MAKKTTLELDEETGKLALKKDPAEALREAMSAHTTPQAIEATGDKMRNEQAEAYAALAEKGSQPQTKEERRAAALERFQQQRAAERQQGAEIG